VRGHFKLLHKEVIEKSEIEGKEKDLKVLFIAKHLV
jgi:hypothetical protein